MLLLPGWGSSAAPWRVNTGEGWEGKMKLRFVKFLTSRENEIEKKEEGGRRSKPAIMRSTVPARPQPALRSRSHFCFLFLSPFPSSSPSTNLPPPPPQLVGRHGLPSSCPSYPSPRCSASPFLLHKITEAVERGGGVGAS